jgi:hypothetical protein
VFEIYYTKDGLSYTSKDLVRMGPSGRDCIEDDERLLDDLPLRRNIGVLEDDDIQISEPDIIYLKIIIYINLTIE